MGRFANLLNGAKNLVTGVSKGLLTTGAIISGAAGADIYARGANSMPGKFAQATGQALAGFNGSTVQQGWREFIKNIFEFVRDLTGGAIDPTKMFPNVYNNMVNGVPARGNTPNITQAIANGIGNNPTDATVAAGVGATAIGAGILASRRGGPGSGPTPPAGGPTGGVTPPAGGPASIAANTADDAARVAARQAAEALFTKPAAQTTDDVARGLGSRLLDGVKSGLSRLPGVGRLFGGAAVVGGGAIVGGAVVNGVLSSEAAAAPASPATPSTPVAPLNRTPSGVPAIAPVVSETAPTARSLAVNVINGAYSGTFNGVATFAGAPVDGATWLINKTVGRGLGFQIDRPFLGSESINNGLTGLRGAYHRAIGNDLDRVQPANTAERVAYEGASLAGNVAASGGALGLLRGAWAKVASGVFTPAAPVSHAAPAPRSAITGGTMDWAIN